MNFYRGNQNTFAELAIISYLTIPYQYEKSQNKSYAQLSFNRQPPARIYSFKISGSQQSSAPACQTLFTQDQCTILRKLTAQNSSMKNNRQNYRQKEISDRDNPGGRVLADNSNTRYRETVVQILTPPHSWQSLYPDILPAFLSATQYL